MHAGGVRTQVLKRNVCSGVVEFVLLTLWPFVKLAHVNHDLAFSVELNMGAIHRPWRRPLEVNCFAVIATAVTGAFEFVFAGLPVRRTSQMCAARVDDKQSIGSLIDPNTVLLLILGIDPQGVVAWKSNFESAGRFKYGARQEEAHEHQEAGGQESRDAGPDNPPTNLVDRRIGT